VGAARSTARTIRAFAAALAVAAAAACGGGGGNSQPPPAAPVTNAVDPATAGSLSGKVTLVGTPPAAQPVRTASDPNCTEPVTPEEIVADQDGALRNVFVYVKDGLGNLVFPVPQTPVVLEQRGCTYRPHVLGIQVGQTLDIVNSDPTLHNIHAIPNANSEFNKGQQLNQRSTHVFSTREVMVPFKCDVHRWMSAYVGVLDHPFFAVTGEGGTFDLTGLPPGTYTIEAVHEKLGRQTQNVTIAEKGTAELAFSFKL
jgi:plastocyanin